CTTMWSRRAGRSGASAGAPGGVPPSRGGPGCSRLPRGCPRGDDMASLNNTYQGQSSGYKLERHLAATQADIPRIAVEVVRSGGMRGLYIAQLPEHAFDHFVIDRLRGPDGAQRIYLRPKVPFGAGAGL